jgi:hypothetical protein
LRQQRLAARQPDLLDSQLYENPYYAQILRNRQFGVDRALVARAAVDATVVATVGDGNAQVGDGAALLIDEPLRVTGALSSRNEMEVRIDIAKAVSPIKALESCIASSSLAQQTS